MSLRPQTSKSWEITHHSIGRTIGKSVRTYHFQYTDGPNEEGGYNHKILYDLRTDPEEKRNAARYDIYKEFVDPLSLMIANSKKKD